MAVLITMLRGINVGGRHMISMGALRELYQSLGLRDVEIYLQSGNAICRTDAQDLALLSKRIESGIERKFGFRPDVIIRRPSDLRKVIARNPFARRRDIDPSRFLVTFLARDPGAEARDQVRTIKTDPEELRVEGREVYVYFPNGMARPKLQWALIEKTLKTSGTGRNWNTVRKLLEMAERLEASP